MKLVLWRTSVVSEALARLDRVISADTVRPVLMMMMLRWGQQWWCAYQGTYYVIIQPLGSFSLCPSLTPPTPPQGPLPLPRQLLRPNLYAVLALSEEGGVVSEGGSASEGGSDSGDGGVMIYLATAAPPSDLAKALGDRPALGSAPKIAGAGCGIGIADRQRHGRRTLDLATRLRAGVHVGLAVLALHQKGLLLSGGASALTPPGVHCDPNSARVTLLLDPIRDPHPLTPNGTPGQREEVRAWGQMLAELLGGGPWRNGGYLGAVPELKALVAGCIGGGTGGSGLTMGTALATLTELRLHPSVCEAVLLESVRYAPPLPASPPKPPTWVHHPSALAPCFWLHDLRRLLTSLDEAKANALANPNKGGAGGVGGGLDLGWVRAIRHRVVGALDAVRLWVGEVDRCGVDQMVAVGTQLVYAALVEGLGRVPALATALLLRERILALDATAMGGNPRVTVVVPTMVAALSGRLPLAGTAADALALKAQLRVLNLLWRMQQGDLGQDHDSASGGLTPMEVAEYGSAVIADLHSVVSHIEAGPHTRLDALVSAYRQATASPKTEWLMSGAMYLL
jgi:hypothetical protein